MADTKIETMTPFSEAREYTHVALMRGCGWLAADLPGHLIIRTGSESELPRTDHADLLVIDPFSGTGLFRSVDGTSKSFKLHETGDWVFIPSFFIAANIPQIVASRVAGILDTKAALQSLQHEFNTKELLLAASCSWFDEQWCAGPLGHRNHFNAWSQLLPTGGRGGLAFTLEPSNGISVGQLSERVLESQVFSMLEEWLVTRYSHLSQSIFVLSSNDIRSAALLVAIRKAVGPEFMSVYCSQKLAPPWKRLLQHLNARVITGEPEMGAALKVDLLLPLLKDLDFDLLLSQINRHSQVIPPSL